VATCPGDAATVDAPLDASDASVLVATSGGTATGGSSCDDIAPPANVPMREYVTPPASPCSYICQPGAADAAGTLAFPRVLGGSSCHAAGVDFVSASGTLLRTTSTSNDPRESIGMYLTTLQQPDGFMVAARGYLAPLTAAVSAWDHAGTFTPGVVRYEAPIRSGGVATIYGPDPGVLDATATNPQGGVLVAGDLRVVPGAAFLHAAAMFERREGTTELRWGLAPLDSDGIVLGVGVDVLGRSLVLTDGASRFGAGQVAAQWFERDGTPLTCAFALLANYAAADGPTGSRAWLETVPIVGGGLAVRRADVTFAADYSARLTRRYVATVETGATRFSAPPSWMAALGGADLRLVRGRRAYAVLGEPQTSEPCTQHVKVIAPDGTPCGGRDYLIADGSCTPLPLTIGEDGTVIQQLPTSLEPVVSGPGGDLRACTWRWWAQALR
jgi:hypothetical protein